MHFLELASLGLMRVIFWAGKVNKKAVLWLLTS